MRYRSLLLALGLAAGCAAEGEPARWHVSNGFLRDPEGRAAILRGMNLSGEHKQSPYFGFHTEADLRRVRDAWGMNSLRFLLIWAAVEPQRGQFDERYLDEVARRLEWAERAGLTVILDMHQDVFGPGFGGDGAPRWACDEAQYAAFKPTTPWFANYTSPQVIACFDHFWTDPEIGAAYAEAWRHVAARFATSPAVIGFDPVNEPHWGSASVWSFEKARLQPFYSRVVAAVRSAAPGWVAFLEPASSRNFGIATSLQPFAERDVVYAPHSYDAQAESGLGFDPAHRAALISNIAGLAGEAQKLGAALWIGEYGGNPDQGGITPYMDASYDGAAAVAASSMYWDYSRGPGYGPLAGDGSEKKELVDALVRPYPERVAGDPKSFAFDEASSTFTLSFTPDPSLSAPTELAVPDRTYPKGYQVECGGCRTEKLPGKLRLLSPPPGAPATLTLRP